jgi:HlyD family secretion protein
MLKRLFTKEFWTKRKIIISLLLLVVIASIAVFSRGGGDGSVVAVEKADIKEEVAVTGKVKAGLQVDMSFDKTGRVARVYRQVGERVEQGQVLAELDYSETAADLAREQSLLRAEQIKLEEIRRNGPSSLKEAEDSLAAAVREAYAAADNSVRNKADQFFKTPRTNPSFEIKITDGNFVHYFSVPTELVLDINNSRRNVEDILNNWPTDGDKAIQSLNIVSSFLDKLAFAVNSFSSADYAYESTVTGFKTAVDAARSAVVSARTKVISAQQSVSSSPVLGSSGVSSVAAQEAKVAQMQASVASIQASINKSRIIAPFSGVVTKQDAKPGETVGAQESLVSLNSDDIYIEANVSEINVGKVAAGNKVEVRFDALPSEVFMGHISFIDPAETVIDQVVNYKLRIELEPDSRITSEVKSGLTANVRIQTREKDAVLAIPSYAITQENGKSFVQKFSSSSDPVKIEVKTGLVGSDGKVEVLSGLEEGDRVIFTK